jgi:hypothetical protein
MHLFFLSVFLILTIHSVQATERDPFTDVLASMLDKKEITQEQADVLEKEVIEVRESLSKPELSTKELDRFWELVDQMAPLDLVSN